MTLLSPRREDAQVRRAAKRGNPVAPPETVQTPLAAGIGAALWSAVVGLGLTTAIVFGTWAAGGREAIGARAALIAGAQGWLLGHGTDLRLESGSLTLAPLGLTLLFAALLARSGIWAGRAAMIQTLREAATATACLTTVYVAVAVGVAIAARSAGVTPVAPTALTGAAALALVAGGLGVLHGSGLLDAALAQLPGDLRLALRGAVGATLTLVAGGAVVFATSLAWHAKDAGQLGTALGVDTAGTVELIALCAAYAPVGAIWAMTYCIGPGFVVGAGTLVAPSGTSLGDLPAFPLLAALPTEGAAPRLALAGLAVPVLAGVVLGLLVARRSSASVSETASVGALAGGFGGVLTGLLAALAHGGLTAGRLASLGPQPFVVALWTAAELAVIGALVAAVARTHALGWRAPRLSFTAADGDDESATQTITLLDAPTIVLPHATPADEWPTAEIPRVVDGPEPETSPGDR